jgi:DNA-binding transcriptional ArsR family regulator
VTDLLAASAESDPAEVFAALSDRYRLAILRELGMRPVSATALAADAPVTRQAVVKHLRVLERVGLVAARRQGREVVYDVRREGLDAPAQWLNDVAAAWDRRLNAVKRAAEGTVDG